jgi:hypothetical protein
MSKELSRTLVCKGQSVVSVAADARVRLSDLPVPTFAGSDTKRPRISTFHTPAAPITYICVKSTSGVERMLKTALRAGPRFVRRILEIGSSPAFAYWARPASDPSSQIRLLVVSVVAGPGRRTQCPDEASRGATRS